MNKAVVFDLGGVLLDWNPRYLFRGVFSDSGEMEYFLREICSLDWNAKMDAGLTFEQGISELLPKYPAYAEQIQIYHTRWSEMLLGEIPDSVAVLAELREAGCKLAALSNWSQEKFQLIRDRYQFLDWFQPLVISGAVGVAKPDPAIYQILLREIRLPAENCIFIDDMPENISQADRQGFDTIQFVSAGSLRQALVARGLLTKKAEDGKQ